MHTRGTARIRAKVGPLAAAFIHGLQGDDLSAPDSAVATPKHFVGDGGTDWGSSTTPGYSIDQGVTTVDDATFQAIHLAPYARRSTRERGSS